MFSNRPHLLPANCCQQSNFDTKLCTKQTICLWCSGGIKVILSLFSLYPFHKSILKWERRDKLNGAASLDGLGVSQFVLDSWNLITFNHTLLNEAELLLQHCEFCWFSTGWYPFYSFPLSLSQLGWGIGGCFLLCLYWLGDIYFLWERVWSQWDNTLTKQSGKLCFIV